MMRRFLFLLALSPAACAAPPPDLDPGAVPVARGIVLALPAPGDLGRDVEAVQMVTARRGEETHVFEARLSVNRERLLLVGTDSLGRRAMTVTWKAGSVTAERAEWLPEALRPENILADIMLLYWPQAVLERTVDGAAVIPEPAGRRIGTEVTVRWEGADPWTGRARLVNASFGYELDIRSVVVGP